jgi:hypothetical protein
MNKIIDFFFEIVTFPGVIIHEMAHQIACRLMKVPVFEVCYFRLNTPCGYVVHDIPKTFAQTVMISIGPFIWNTLLGVAAYIPGRFSANHGIVEYFFIWLGGSIIIHAIPSQQDIDHISNWLEKKKVSAITKWIFYPATSIIKGVTWIGTTFIGVLHVGIITLVVEKLILAI